MSAPSNAKIKSSKEVTFVTRFCPIKRTKTITHYQEHKLECGHVFYTHNVGAQASREKAKLEREPCPACTRPEVKMVERIGAKS